MMSKEKRRVPKLRFPGFTEDWEQRKFGDLFEYERPDAYIVKSDNYNNDFNMPVLTANKAFILGYTNEENSYNKPSIIFDDFTLDRKYVDFPYMLKSSAIKILTSKNQHNLRFLFERLNSTRFEVLGHARHYISVVQNTTTLCPSIDEEVCISNLLTKFDELITLHQRKLDNLKLKKKALLQKLFPKNGDRYPELRFPGFTDAWEQRKLGDLAEIVRGASPRPISDSKWFDNNSDVGWLRISDVTAQDGRIQYLEQKISKLGQDKTRVVKTPHLLLSIAATVGKPVINYVPTGVHDGFLIFLNPKFNILYAFWWLEIFREEWNKYGQPGSQVNLNSDLVKNQVINIPNEKEQEKISSFLEALDRIITLHQQEPFLCGNSVNGGVELC